VECLPRKNGLRTPASDASKKFATSIVRMRRGQHAAAAAACAAPLFLHRTGPHAAPLALARVRALKVLPLVALADCLIAAACRKRGQDAPLLVCAEKYCLLADDGTLRDETTSTDCCIFFLLLVDNNKITPGPRQQSVSHHEQGPSYSHAQCGRGANSSNNNNDNNGNTSSSDNNNNSSNNNNNSNNNSNSNCNSNCNRDLNAAAHRT
jgi:hypothetical protein